MRNRFYKMKSSIYMTIFALLAAISSLFLMSGCTETLEGEKVANQKPIVYFVNIPPEGQEFSRNPVIYWVGTDRDGQIDFFRYHVATMAEIGYDTAVSGTDTVFTPIDPDEYILTIPDGLWIVLDVDHKAGDPRTTNTISMSADLNDPVNTFIDQYVFLQAYDEAGLGSDIIHRLFSRNDNPPQTLLYGITLDSPFVNSVNPGGVITGVKMRWGGTDPIDYPADPPPFEYDWKLFGPYTEEQYDTIQSQFVKIVYVTSDARVFNLGDTIITCDTSFVDNSTEIVCDTILVTDSTATSAFGRLDVNFDYLDPSFTDSGFYTVPATSGTGSNPWVMATADTIYDVFTDYYQTPIGSTIDTTVEMYFFFTIRSRDDAQVADLVPAFKSFTVIDALKERDVAVIDYNAANFFSINNWTNYKSIDLVKSYWYDVLDKWRESRPDLFPEKTGLEFFDTTTIFPFPKNYRWQSPDYIRASYLQELKLVELLKHKLLIVYHDDIREPGFMRKSGPLFTAIDAGINVWVTSRNLLWPQYDICDIISEEVPIPNAYRRYFGVDGTVFSGYVGNLLTFNPCAYSPSNIADFVGAYSMNSTKWPELMLDEQLLFDSYYWTFNLIFPELDLWNPDAPALPEVNWSVRSFGTEVMYLYRSAYGSSHPIAEEFSFDGAPVAHRLPTTLYRTVHFNFTPLAMQPDSMQLLTNDVLNWLYPEGAAAVSAMPNNYKDANVKISLEDARANFIERRIESTLMKNPEAIIDQAR